MLVLLQDFWFFNQGSQALVNQDQGSASCGIPLPRSGQLEIKPKPTSSLDCGLRGLSGGSSYGWCCRLPRGVLSLFRQKKETPPSPLTCTKTNPQSAREVTCIFNTFFALHYWGPQANCVISDDITNRSSCRAVQGKGKLSYLAHRQEMCVWVEAGIFLIKKTGENCLAPNGISTKATLPGPQTPPATAVCCKKSRRDEWAESGFYVEIVRTCPRAAKQPGSEIQPVLCHFCSTVQTC